MSTILNVLHVVGAVFIVGPMAILPMSALRALRADNTSGVAALAESTRIFSLLSLVVVVLGFGVVGVSEPSDDFSFTTPWILTSLIVYIVALLLSLFQVVPALRRASVNVNVSSSASEVDAAASNNGYTAIAAGSGIVSFLLVVVVALMVWKP
jgi:uncharacterized membrane protein